MILDYTPNNTHPCYKASIILRPLRHQEKPIILKLQLPKPDASDVESDWRMCADLLTSTALVLGPEKRSTRG
uniref:Uncharacterized protein n=1 Tax=Megaselia scalaris TaxID=36166 RepID=T1H346_MEGSC